MPSVGPAELLIVVIIPLIFIAFFVGAVMAVRRGTAASDAAMDSLRRRLAAGEIDEIEYRRLRSVLRGH